MNCREGESKELSFYLAMIVEEVLQDTPHLLSYIQNESCIRPGIIHNNNDKTIK